MIALTFNFFYCSFLLYRLLHGWIFFCFYRGKQSPAPTGFAHRYRRSQYFAPLVKKLPWSEEGWSWRGKVT